MSNNYIDENEKKRLNSLSYSNIIALDPAPILDALRIDYISQKNGTEYIFKSHHEDTPSSRFKLYSNGWAFINFADRNIKGTVINLVKHCLYNKVSDEIAFPEAMNYIYNNLPGAINYFEQAVGMLNVSNKVSINIEKRLKELEDLRELNRQKSEKYSTSSKVLSAYQIYTSNEKCNEFLTKRGLSRTPPFIMFIKGEWEKFNDKTGEIENKNSSGIGVLTGNLKQQLENIKNKKELSENSGADIHYLNPYKKSNGSIAKTQSFGDKKISYWLANNPNDEVLIFESKFDAAAEWCRNPSIWENKNVIISNGVGQFEEIIQFLKDYKIKKVVNYNQNDIAAIEFINNIAQGYDIKDYTFIKYNVDEHKLDINDLLKNNTLNNERFIHGENIIVHLKNYLLNTNKNINILNQKLPKHFIIDEELQRIDTKIINAVGTVNNDIEKYLSDNELKRYNELLNNGFIKDKENREILDKNKGLSIDSLMKLVLKNNKEIEKEKVINILNNKGVVVIKEIKNNEDLSSELNSINLKSEEEYSNFTTILDYIETKKDDENVISIINEWVKNCCENNTKDNIEKARLFYFIEIEERIEKKLKLLNIGKNIDSKKTSSSIEVKNDDKNQEFSFDFKPQEEELDNNDNDDVLIPVNNNVQDKETPSNNTQPNIPNQINKEEVSIDLDNELDRFSAILTNLNTDLAKVKDVDIKENNELKRIVIDDSKTAVNSIWNRLNEKDVINRIKEEKDKTKQKAYAQKRTSVSIQCKNVLSVIQEIETPSSQKESKKINTKNSEKLLSELTIISNKIHKTVELMQNTYNEIKKNAELIKEEEIEQVNTREP